MGTKERYACDAPAWATQHNVQNNRRDILLYSCVWLCVFLSQNQNCSVAQISAVAFWILNLKCTNWELFSTHKHTLIPWIIAGCTFGPLFTPVNVVITEASQSEKEKGNLWLLRMHFPTLFFHPCRHSYSSSLETWSSRTWLEKQYLQSQQSLMLSVTLSND